MLTIGGMNVIVHKGRVYNYQLPEEVIPGVPWPVGFREEFNEWAKIACGSQPIISDGTVYMVGHIYKGLSWADTIMANPRTSARIINLDSATELSK